MSKERSLHLNSIFTISCSLLFRFKCHYCPFASNSEDAVKQHSSAKHPKLQSEVLDVSQRTKVQRRETSVSVEVTSPEKNKESQKQEGVVSPSVESSQATTLEPSTVSLQSSEENTDETYEKETCIEKDTLEDSQPSVTKTYSCPFCSFTINTSSGLNHHKRTKHREKRLFMCLYCKGRFSTNVDALRHHKWKHLPQKPNIVHMVYNKAEESSGKEQTEGSYSESSEVTLSSRSNTVPKLTSDPKPVRSKAKKSFTKSSFTPVASNSSSELASNLQALAPSNLSSEPTYTCCHCNQQSTKVGMEEHMKKQHRDLPYQVRREEKDRIFTEVHIYKCIHCIVESISLAQAMDHWIQNHPLFDFKFDLVLRHSGEVSNQVVSSTTVDKDLVHGVTNTEGSVCLNDIDVSTTREDVGVTTSSAVASCSDITSSSEYRDGQKDASSPRHNLDIDEEEIMDVSEVVGNIESEIQSSTEAENEDMIYKCGLCKKSSDRLQELKAHMNKVNIK